MDSRFFLYIDVLGFSDLIKNTERVEKLYAILDSAAVHGDSNYRTIVFSDTIVAYHKHTNLKGSIKATELMFLIELTQELFLRLISSGIYFRAVITEGPFHHRRLKNLEAFYGQALVDAYRAEKALPSIGLFLDNKLRRFNRVFRWLPFTSQFDFVFLTHYTSRLIPRPEDLLVKDELLSNPDFPLPGVFLSSQGTEFYVYPELVHFREVHGLMTNHPMPDVRAKFLAAWNMYCLAYPKLMRSLVDCQFAPEGLAEMDWSEAKQQFDEERVQ